MDPTHLAKYRFTKRATWRWLVCLAGLFVLALPVLALEEDSFLTNAGEEESDWSRNFRIGALVGFNIKANFKMKGQEYPVATRYSDGQYDDGYVITDPNNTGDRLTSNWGYNHASQYDSANSRLAMHRTTSFTTAGDSVKAEDSSYLGFDLAYGGNLWKRERLRIGWEFGFSLLPISITDNKSMTVTNNLASFTFDTRETDNPNVNPDALGMPAAGYRGGPSSGTGTSRWISSNPEEGSTSTSETTLTGSRSIDVILYTFRLGPTFYWDLTPHVALTAGGGAALGIVSGDYKYNEMIGDTPNKGKISMTDVVYGGYINAMVLYHAENNGDLYLGVQYMPMGTASVSSGGRQAQLDLSGQVYISAGFNWPF